jgi:hypothetical protein
VFSALPEKGWKQLSNGLPAVASALPAFSATMCLLSMSNGGIYGSTGDLQEWQRLDKDGEQSATNSIVWVGGGKFVVASTSEGVLDWEAPDSGGKETGQR